MHRTIAALALTSAAVAGSVAFAADTGRIGPSLKIVNNGRHLTPYGRLVNVGNVPTGGGTRHPKPPYSPSASAAVAFA